MSASLCGIEPVWASEVEPYPIAVTTSRFSKMKHLGDISKINGAEIEPVDIVSFGSPCQDLSVAGLRKGLKHEDNGDEETTRSGLFMEAIRIIKEMREATNGRYPTFALWENVPGAFSSNKGEDFRVVLEELIKIAEPSAVMPAVPQKGWAYADYYCGDGWSIAYRVLDAQYIRTAQRRRRIYLVLDLGGQRARKILFERESLRGYPPQSGTQRQATPADAQGGVGADDRARCVGFPLGFRPENVRCYDEKATTVCNGTRPGFTCGVIAVDQGGGKSGANFHENLSPTLTCTHGGEPAVAYTLEPGIAAREGGHIYEGVSGTLRANAGDNQTAVAYAVENHPADSRVNIDESGKVQCLTSRMGTGGGNVPMVMEQVPFCKSARARSADDATTWKEGKVANTLNTFDQGEARANELVVESTAECIGFHITQDPIPNKEIAPCIGTGNPITGQATVGVAYSLQGNIIDRDAKQNGNGICEDKAHTLNAVDRHGVSYAETYQEPITIHGDNKTGTLLARDFKGAGRWDSLDKVIAIDRAFYNQGQNALYEPQTYEDGTCPTLVAKGPGADCTREKVRYIVRRLTPTECARLQGFPDKWGHPDRKDDFTGEEYRFWLDVRNTHAEINGKAVKEYTKQQVLTWYNKLHTDSSEYKMWGNGIALPCALYVMQGIEDALKGE